MLRSGLKQAFRMPGRMVAYFLVTALVCAFLCIGLNLKQIADGNLQNILDYFNVVALPDFQTYINEHGKATATLQDSVGYLPCKAVGYDLSKLSALPGVVKIDARNQFGACINNHQNLLYSERMQSQTSLRYNGADVVIFQVNSSQAVTVPGVQKKKVGNSTQWLPSRVSVPVNMLWSAAGRRLDVSTLNFQNGTDTVYLMEPGKTYIVNMGCYGNFSADIYHNPDQIYVQENGAYLMKDDFEFRHKYEPLTEYYDGFWDADMGKYYRQSAEACYLNGNSMTAITTGDLSLIPAWSSGEIYLKQGRLFSEEDYQMGNKVCIVSMHFLKETGWNVGDTIDLSFYETDYILSQYMRNQFSTFDPCVFDNSEVVSRGETGSFPLDYVFDENVFTIVGAYDGNVCFRDEHESYLFNESMHWTMILFPENSIENQPNVKLSPYMTTIQLEPLMIQKFLAAAQASGLMDQQPYGYQLGLTIDDHGLSNMIAGLESLQQVSRLTLMLASVTAALAVLVLAILHLLQNRKQIAILRSMGVRKGQVTACVLAGILLVCILGSVLGAWCGEKLSEKVVQTILENAQEETLDSSFSAMLATDDDAEDDFQLTAEADSKLTLLTAGVISAAMILVATTLVLWETRKPPLLMLGVKE